MKITFKGMKLEAVRSAIGDYRLEAEAGRYFIRVSEAVSGNGWVASIWKYTSANGNCEIVRNVYGAKGGLTRRATARAMMRAALADYGRVVPLGKVA